MAPSTLSNEIPARRVSVIFMFSEMISKKPPLVSVQNLIALQRLLIEQFLTVMFSQIPSLFSVQDDLNTIPSSPDSTLISPAPSIVIFSAFSPTNKEQ